MNGASGVAPRIIDGVEFICDRERPLKYVWRSPSGRLWVSQNVGGKGTFTAKVFDQRYARGVRVVGVKFRSLEAAMRAAVLEGQNL